MGAPAVAFTEDFPSGVRSTSHTKAAARNEGKPRRREGRDDSRRVSGSESSG